MTTDAQRTAATALMPFDGGILLTDAASNRKRNRFLFSGGRTMAKKCDFA
jgi:hypothetical protein